MSEPTDIDTDEEEFAESTLIQAIEYQIASDNPPAAKATFNKLPDRKSTRLNSSHT